jgi:hypothetical protein
VRELFPKSCQQWEDFADINAMPILARCRMRSARGSAGAVALGLSEAARRPLAGHQQTARIAELIDRYETAATLLEQIEINRAPQIARNSQENDDDD